MNCTYQSDRELEQYKAEWEQTQREKELALHNERQKVEEARAAVRQQEADNWLVTQRVRSEESAVKLELSRVMQEKELVSKRDQELKQLEDQRRRNR